MKKPEEQALRLLQTLKRNSPDLFRHVIGLLKALERIRKNESKN